MKYTLLELVQDILSSMDSDEVNSISDTVESEQVAKIIRTCYEEIKDRADLPEHYSIINLQSSGDSDKPVLMYVPSDVSELVWVKYNIETADDTDYNYQLMKYLPLEQFLNRMHGLSESATNVETFTHTESSHDITFLYQNNKPPEYYTTFDDYTLVFDSYDSEVDTTLQSSKTQCYAKLVTSFTMADNFEPDLDEAQFVLLKNMAKSLAWAELKQTIHPNAERTSNRAWRRLQTKQNRIKTLSYLDQLPNFGRK